MKKYIIIISILPSVLFASTLNIQSIVTKIKALQSNTKISSQLDYNVYDPFATAKPILIQKMKNRIKIQKKSSILIQTILNKKVLVGGKWLKVGDKVQGATIKTINKDNIVIFKDNKWTKVSFKRKKDIIKIKKVSN